MSFSFVLSYFNLYSLIAFHLSLRLMDIEANRFAGEIGHVIAVEQFSIVLPRVTLWQEEGFGAVAIVIDAGKEELGIHAVRALRGKDKPVGVRTPVVKAFHIVAVHLVQKACFSRLQVHQPEISIALEDREVAAITQGEHEPTTIVAGTSLRGASSY